MKESIDKLIEDNRALLTPAPIMKQCYICPKALIENMTEEEFKYFDKTVRKMLFGFVQGELDHEQMVAIIGD